MSPTNRQNISTSSPAAELGGSSPAGGGGLFLFYIHGILTGAAIAALVLMLVGGL